MINKGCFVSYIELLGVFAKTGASAFGGWSTTALLLEKELVENRNLLEPHDIKGASMYAQILPGATQVSIVANVGYRLRGFAGACMATTAYLLPSIGLITLFAIVYFHFADDTSNIMQYMDGLVAALAGVILANAYKIGSKHTTKIWLWLLAGLAFVAKLWLGINALLIIVVFGLSGLALSWIYTQEDAR
jgi:chromate transporter